MNEPCEKLPQEADASSGSDAKGRLRYAPLWWTIGWLLVAAVVIGSLRPATELPLHLASDKVAHFSAYCTMAFWFAGMTDRRRYPFLAVLLLILGAVIEFAQGAMGFGRDADWHDFVANALGVGVAIMLAYAGLGSWMSRIEQRFARF